MLPEKHMVLTELTVPEVYLPFPQLLFLYLLTEENDTSSSLTTSKVPMRITVDMCYRTLHKVQVSEIKSPKSICRVNTKFYAANIYSDVASVPTTVSQSYKCSLKNPR